MDILSLSKLEEGAKINIRVMISDKKLLQKANKEDYLSLDVQDATGKLNFPVWQEANLLYDSLEIGSIIDIADATLGYWNGVPQFKNPKFHILTEEELQSVSMSQFIPSYEIPEELIQEMESVISSLEEPYQIIAVHATGAFGSNKQRWKAFLECVSAEKHHGNKRGGLFLHTIGVLKNTESILVNYVTKPYFYDASSVINISRLRLKAILHDIKKVDEYEYQTNIRRKQNRPIGHLYDGVAFLREINNECGNILSREEEDDIAWSILTHHGQWGPAMPETPEDWILHLADMIDSKIVGSVEK